MHKHLYAFIGCISLLAGCATDMPLSVNDKASLSSVSISNNVELDEHPMFMSRAQARGAALAGVVGYGVAVAATAGSGSESLGTLSGYMKSNNISIAEIVRTEFKNQISSHPTFKGKLVQQGGDAEFRLKAAWAMGQESFGPNYKPGITIWAELVKNGQVIWRGKDYVTPLSDQVGGHPWPELFSSTDVLRQLYADAARQVIANVLRDI